jgi:hypothetical protein
MYDPYFLLGLGIVGIGLIMLGISYWFGHEKFTSDAVSPTRADRKSQRYAK